MGDIDEQGVFTGNSLIGGWKNDRQNKNRIAIRTNEIMGSSYQTGKIGLFCRPFFGILIDQTAHIVVLGIAG